MEPNATKPDAVRNLQRYLRRLSFVYPTILPVPVDGIFAERTEEALSEFQRLWSLPVTGRANRITWDALFEEYRRLRIEEDRRLSPQLFPDTPVDYVTTPEESGAFILFLQFLLVELTALYDTLPAPPLTGIFDEETRSSLQEYRRLHGLEEAPVLDQNTWNLLSEDHNRALSS